MRMRMTTTTTTTTTARETGHFKCKLWQSGLARERKKDIKREREKEKKAISLRSCWYRRVSGNATRSFVSFPLQLCYCCNYFFFQRYTYSSFCTTNNNIRTKSAQVIKCYSLTLNVHICVCAFESWLVG